MFRNSFNSRNCVRARLAMKLDFSLTIFIAPDVSLIV